MSGSGQTGLIMHRASTCLPGLFLAMVIQATFVGPAAATLLYEANTFVDTATGLRWQSTSITLGQPGPQIPDDRIVGGGLRLATKDEVEALFTGNFPQLGPVLNTFAATATDPAVTALIDALGGGPTSVTLEIDGVIVLVLPSYHVEAWIAAPAVRTSIDQTNLWEYRPLSIGYGSFCASFPPCDPPTTIFSSVSPLSGYLELSATDAGARGYFLVSAAVPEPPSGLLLASGLLLLLPVARRAQRLSFDDLPSYPE